MKVFVLFVVLLLVTFIFWLLTLTSSRWREQFDYWKESIKDWWAIDTDVPQRHLNKQIHFKHFYNPQLTKLRHEQKNSKKYRIPSGARLHANDSNCYYYRGNEFCIY
jgi:hypothetical protein